MADLKAVAHPSALEIKAHADEAVICYDLRNKGADYRLKYHRPAHGKATRVPSLGP